MALWGNKDGKTATGTIAIADTGVVTGVSTLFTTEAKVGNTIRANGLDYLITTITSNTEAKVRMGKNNGDGLETVVNAGTSYTLSEKPAFVALESADSGIGITGDSNRVFGVDAAEDAAGGDNVTNVAVVAGRTRYLEVPAVSFSGGGGTLAAATASIAAGAVTAIAVSNTGSGYTSVPTVTIDKPKRTIPATTGAVNTAIEQFTFTNHGLTAAESVKYITPGAAIGGIANNTEYFVSSLGLAANVFRIANTALDAAGRAALANVQVANSTGLFTCTTTTLAPFDRVLITGTNTGTGNVVGYSTGTIYSVAVVTGSNTAATGFQLQTDNGVAISTPTNGTTTGLTITPYTITPVSSTGATNQFFEIQAAADQATATASLGSGAGGSVLTHAGWVRRTVGTGGRAGRINQEVLVAMGSVTGDQDDDVQYPDT
jgi:hypothetical protein